MNLKSRRSRGSDRCGLTLVPAAVGLSWTGNSSTKFARSYCGFLYLYCHILLTLTKLAGHRARRLIRWVFDISRLRTWSTVYGRMKNFDFSQFANAGRLLHLIRPRRYRIQARSDESIAIMSNTDEIGWSCSVIRWVCKWMEGSIALGHKRNLTHFSCGYHIDKIWVKKKANCMEDTLIGGTARSLVTIKPIGVLLRDRADHTYKMCTSTQIWEQNIARPKGCSNRIVSCRPA